jgi:dienelactone hydrolase
LPETPDGPAPAVIALHGAGGGVSGMDLYASTLAAQGFAVYLLHYFDRTGIDSADKPTILRNFPLWMKTLWDAISFVETQPQVDSERIALLGFSLGAYLSLANSAIDHRVKAVVEFFGGMPKEMNLFMRRLCPVLILHGEADPTVPVEEAYGYRSCWRRRESPTKSKSTPAPATVSNPKSGATQVFGACNFCRNIWLSTLTSSRRDSRPRLSNRAQLGSAQPSDSRKTKRSTEQARGEHHCGPDEGECSVDGNPKQAEGQQQQPHDRIEDQRQQCHGPAQDEEKAPEQERDHGDTSY